MFKKEFNLFPIFGISSRLYGGLYTFKYDDQIKAKYYKINYQFYQYLNPSIKAKFKEKNYQLSFGNRFQVDSNILIKSKLKTYNDSINKLKLTAINKLDDPYNSKVTIKTSGKSKFSLIYQGKPEKDIKLFVIIV